MNPGCCARSKPKRLQPVTHSLTQPHSQLIREPDPFECALQVSNGAGSPARKEEEGEKGTSAVENELLYSTV